VRASSVSIGACDKSSLSILSAIITRFKNINRRSTIGA
jgi:hypothetical protein